MLKQSLQQRLLQKLSPQQIQVIKMLELPTLQLEERIKKELEENPVLEEGGGEEEYQDDNQNEEIAEKDNDKEEFSLEDYMNDEDIPSYKLSAQNYSKDDKHEEIPFSGGTTFHEVLISQLGLRILPPQKMALTEYLIGNIDEDGYLRRDIDNIVDDLAFSTGIETSFEELVELLRVIQDFDPAGVGARDLQECLLLQIERRGKHNPDVKLAKQILKKHFEEFTRKHYDKIQKRLNVNDEDFKCAIDEILKLNPKPGGAFNNPMEKASPTIIPDFMLEEQDGDLFLSLNSRNVPELHVSRSYSEMLHDYSKNKKNQSREQKDAAMFVKQKLDSAKWFIDAIKQRQNTLLLTMNAIIDFQREYFYEGDEKKLKPMILKDIAEITGLDISTISRVSNSKYIQTHFGIFSLKYFFSEGMQTDSGEEVSTREIKKILQECVDGEDKRKPLTDDKLAAILKEKSYQIARRTVAKYREQLNIPVARLRKEL
ncbi:RNA polymerase factor sigma-54 [Ancylomarina longa]|uniref:RNA polymerase sigma-54 factor n=1 Tax=Ancylomarina longa TaxID=2487017 RepID=A0A434AFK9_9BACT|nr:RNA polymerase factor sigma-54 [Ancylomarina longa]RUT73138.1 RNA polymerase sigma-54 factor [Ancylomarina longa]